MPERAILRDHFSAMLQAAESVAAEYERIARSADNEQARGQLERLAEGERRQVELTQRLMEIVDE